MLYKKTVYLDFANSLDSGANKGLVAAGPGTPIGAEQLLVAHTKYCRRTNGSWVGKLMLPHPTNSTIQPDDL